MRKGRYLVGLAALLGPATVLSVGCIDAIADYYTPLTDPKLATWDDGGPEGGSNDGGDGGDADGNTLDCSGDPSSTNVIEACGVFAQADAAVGGDGSMATPFAKLADAITAAQAAGKRVYACTSAPFHEAVTLSAGIEVYGGLDCTKGWAWSESARATLDGPADAVALTVTSAASGAKVEGFAIAAAGPSSMTMGGSSIAVVVVDDVAVTLDHCDVTASDAADGVNGTAPSGVAVKGEDAPAPDPGTMNACINPASVNGGVPGVTMCGVVDASGGVGGKGGITGMPDGNGQKGADGSPGDMMNGLGGAGESTSKCVSGGTGHDGTDGNPGPGGSSVNDALSLSGITNGDVTDGQPGTPGQGGGGGGGAKSGTFCPPAASPVDGPGASGGGGGAGGCGGLGGGGGQAGGSSIAIVSLGTKLTLTVVTLTAGKGGKGGSGTAGQGGGAYGNGANGGAASGIAGSKAGCQGGNGGSGGDGGPGGGGRGGHALGIAYASAPATMPALQMFTSGTAGNGGTAGSGAPSSSNGANGNQGPCWDLSAGMACK